MIGDPANDLEAGGGLRARCLSYPGSSGEIRDYRAVIDKLHGAGALAIMATDLLALGAADAARRTRRRYRHRLVQRFGVPMGYGGPHAAFFATRDEYKRAMPGRIIGVSVDSHGHPAPCAWRCRRASSISAARRRPATSAPRRCCSPSSPRCSPSITVPRASGRRRSARTAWPRSSRRPSKASAMRSQTKAFFDTVTMHAARPRPCHCSPAPSEKRINLRFVDADHARHLLRPVDAPRGARTPAHRVQDRCAASASTIDALDARARRSHPAGAAAQDRPISPIRSSRCITPRPRCCAICASCRRKDIALDRSMIPLGLLHHEAQCHDRDDPGHLARIRHDASLCAARAGARLSAALRGARGDAGRDHRLRRGVAAAQCRQPGRICRAACHPQLSPGERRGPSRCLPHPGLGAWHQSGFRGDGRA